MRGTSILIKGAAAAVIALWMMSLVAPAARADDAQALYGKYCNSCHGPSGNGDGPASKMLKPPPPQFSSALKGVPDADLFKIVKDGGKAAGKSVRMPAFGSKLSDDQIHSLIEYAKGLGTK
jgi:high-affinity iron transporter